MRAISTPHGQRKRTPDEEAALWKRFRGELGTPARQDLIPRLKLIGDQPVDIDWSKLVRLVPGDELRGEALMRRVWRAGQERYELESDMLPWQIEEASLHFRDRMHRFDWLADLCDAGPDGAGQALSLVDAWINIYGQFDGFAWRAGPCADRVWHWLMCGRTLFSSNDQTPDKAQQARLGCLLRQIDHLDRIVDTTPDIEARLRAACGLALFAALARQQRKLRQALDRLETECNAQILPDGGHVSRSPQRLLDAMLDLATLRDTLIALDHEPADFMTKWLPRMGAMLAFFRCADGALHPFNDSAEARTDLVEAALKTLDTPPRRFSVSPKSGFQKLERGGARVILDVGEAPQRAYGDMAHAGALGFELADGPARLVTSCGFSREVNLDWQAAVRRSGAHSTLVLGGRDSAVFQTNDPSGLLVPVGPPGVSAKRLEEADEVWLDAQHSGYKEPFGLLHHRRLFLAGDGSRLTGEDSLVRPVSRSAMETDRPISFEIRFHLHPSVTALMGRDGITLTSETGARWYFKTSHAGARLEPSVYLARRTVEDAEQIVLTGRADPNRDGARPPNCVRWAFLRETPDSDGTT